jgi:hypothetical protein
MMARPADAALVPRARDGDGACLGDGRRSGDAAGGAIRLQLGPHRSKILARRERHLLLPSLRHLLVQVLLVAHELGVALLIV